MAVYDGFFDAVQDEESGAYDRAYTSGDFTGYFGEIIGSGVCVHNDPDSFKVRLEDGAAVVSPGYLFIQGYWLRSTEDYTIPLTGTGTLAIAAHLNTGKRMIELEARSMAQSYPDSLVLALVTPASATVEDTRYNADICGIIDTAGSLSGKVEYAIHYIDTEIEDKLAQAEADINAQAARLDAKIAEVQAVADRIAPPPIGSIQFSASQDVDEEWLKCDGSFINEADYPELVAALGKLTPGVSDFSEKANGGIPMDISNGVLYNEVFWIFSYTDKKLYGIPEDGSVLETISVSGADLLENPRIYPIYLTILDGELFIAQQRGTKIGTDLLLYLNYNFDNTATSVDVTRLQFSYSTNNPSPIPVPTAPYVSRKRQLSGEYKYYIAAGVRDYINIIGVYFSWDKETAPEELEITLLSGHNFNFNYENSTSALAIQTFSQKNAGDFIYSYHTAGSYVSGSTYPTEASVQSVPDHMIRGEVGSENAKNDRTYKTVSVTDFSGFLMIKYKIEGGQLVVHSQSITSGEYSDVTVSSVNIGSRASAFVDAALYLEEQNLWMFFVGTGIVFTSDLTNEKSYGFLDTSDVLGIITRFGYMEHDASNNVVYISGQDTTNVVKVAALKIPTLYDYANDGAWLPMIASDGVPAYIKAKGTEEPVGPTVPAQIKIVNNSSKYVSVLFNGEKLIPGTYTRQVSENGKFSIGLRLESKWNGSREYGLNLNGASTVRIHESNSIGAVVSESFNTQDYIAGVITLTTTL